MFTKNLYKSIIIYFVFTLSYSISAAQCPVVINEVMVTPAGDASVNALYNGDTLNGANPLIGSEWIELYNMDPCHSFDIGCFLLATATTNGIDTTWGTYLFPGGTIIPPMGHYLVGGSAITTADFTLSFFTNAHWCSSKKWALDDQAGWVGLYNLLSIPVSAVYWTQSGSAANLQTDPQFNLDVYTSLGHCTCCSPSLLSNAKNFPGIEYAGNIIPNSNRAITRIVDGSPVWGLSANGGTPDACNAGTDSCYYHDAQIVFSSPLCPGGSNGTAEALSLVIGNPNEPYTYHWSNQQTTQAIQNLTAGAYSVTITDKWGCSVVDTVNIPDPIAPVLTIINNSPVCENGTLNLSADISGINYVWSGPSNFSSTESNPTLTGFEQSNSGVYYLTLTDSQNCQLNATAQIEMEALPMVNLGPDTLICTHQNIILNPGSGNNYSYHWYNGATTETLSISGAAQLNAQNPLLAWVAVDGCNTVYDSVLINITICDITIPNVFTPNGDNINDKFIIEGIEKFPDSELLIFNRWGKKIYENSNYQNTWDGENLSEGVYYFILNLASSPVQSYHGEITILKK